MSAHNNISSQSCQGYRWIPVNSVTISVPFCSRETFCFKAVQHSFSLLQLLCLTSAAKRRDIWQWSEMQAENTDMFQHAINSSWVPCHTRKLEGNPHLSICLHQGSVSSQVWYHPDMPSSFSRRGGGSTTTEAETPFDKGFRRLLLLQRSFPICRSSNKNMIVN